MPAISFSGQTNLGPFWKLIRAEIKTQTCRKPRKRPIKEGDLLFMYWKQRVSRKKKAEMGEPHKIAVGRVVKVEKDTRYADFVFDDDFAFAEGFESVEEMQCWFGDPYENADEEWDVIKWRLISSPDMPPIFPGILAMVEE